MDFVLLAGGTLIGLGVTLLVESLIALLFRIEKVATEGAAVDLGGKSTDEEPADRDQGAGEDSAEAESARSEKAPPEN